MGLTIAGTFGILSNVLGGSHCGEVSEWFMELVLKTSDSRERTMGSNPILSAIFAKSELSDHFDLWSNTQEVEEAPLLRA